MHWVYVMHFSFPSRNQMHFYNHIIFYDSNFKCIGFSGRIFKELCFAIFVVSIVSKLPKKHHTIPAEVLPNDSDALC